MFAYGGKLTDISAAPTDSKCPQTTIAKPRLDGVLGYPGPRTRDERYGRVVVWCCAACGVGTGELGSSERHSRRVVGCVDGGG